MIAKFVNGTHKEALALWHDLAKSANNADKARAIELWARIAQFVCPRPPLEVTGEEGGPIIIEFPPIPGA